MSLGRSAALAGIAAVSCLAVLAAPALASSPADWMYEPTTFTEIRLTLPQASYEQLEAHPEDEYVPGTFSIAETNGTPGEVGPFSTPIEVGIRLKGSLGSLRSINQKAAFKLKINSVVKGQTFDGLEKMTLNNMVQDASMTHEVLAYRAFHDMGVYAPHTGYTYLWVNGKSYGLHLNIETQDKIALEKQFGPFQNPPQHLYEGEYGADVSTSTNPMTGHPRWEDLEVDEGKSSKKEDLEALLAAVEGTSGSFSERVAGLADLPEMTRMWLTEKYIGHWDGYSGMPPDMYRPNNYYLYSDANGRFQIFPWGTDQTWAEHLGFESPGGALFSDCLGDTAGCRPLYRAAGEQALTRLNADELLTTARCTATAVNRWREYELDESEASKLPEYDFAATLQQQAAAREFIAQRPAELATFLGEPSPPPPSGEPACPPLRPIGGFPPTVTTSPTREGPPPTAAPGPAPSPPRFLQRRLRRNGIAVVLDAPAGRVTVAGTFATPGGAATACRGSLDLAAAGPASVRCRFTKAFERRLRERRAGIRLTASVTPAGGVAISTPTKLLRVPRR